MKRKPAILILLIIFFLTIGIVASLHFFLTTVAVSNIDMDLRVGDRIGINVDNDKIWFGMTNPGGTSSRKLILKNDYDFPIMVRFTVFGELKDYVAVAENNFVLEQDAQKEIGVTAKVPKDMPYGNYTGTLRVVFKKA